MTKVAAFGHGCERWTSRWGRHGMNEFLVNQRSISVGQPASPVEMEHAKTNL
jgi:hypothetical protein